MRILCVDDHELFREGLRQVLTGLDGEPDILGAGTGSEALGLAAKHEHEIGLVLLDLGLPDMDGFALLRELRSRYPQIPVAVVSATESPRHMRLALEGEASGFITKSSDRTVLLHALQLILAGGTYVPAAAIAATAPLPDGRVDALTPRQREVAELLSRGLTNKEIADVLGIRAFTVKAHVAAILEALQVTNRTEAVRAMLDAGLFDSEE